MPTYQYRCTNCGHEIEAVQKFSDPPLTVCDQCQGALRKVYNPVGVVFKGSGFYATDNRTKGAAKAASSSEGSESGTSANTGSGSTDTGTSKTASAGKTDSAAPSSSSAPASSPSAAKPASGN